MTRSGGFAALLLCTLLQAQKVPTAARQQDLDFISTQLPKLHPNFFFQLDPAMFQQAVTSLNSRIATASDAEFYVGIGQLVALAGDAHTNLYLSGSASQSLGFQTLPLTFRWLDDGIFVTGAPAAYARALGTRVVAVGETPIDQVVQQLATVIPHGNDQWVHHEVQQDLAALQILQGLHILPANGTAPFTFQTLAGDQFTLQVTPGSGPLVTAPDRNTGPLPGYLQNTAANYWYAYSAPNRLLYFKYNLCSDDPSNPFASFAAKLLNTMDQNPVDTFVFDFRDNPGGGSAVWGPLLDGLQSRLPRQLANPRFRIYGVIDKGTFSSGMDNAMSLKQPLPPELTTLAPGVDFRHLIQIVGEPSGGKPAEYGQVQNFVLPGSRVGGQYSTKYFPNPDYIPDLPSFVPDIPVSLRSTDYFTRNDPAMAAILARTSALPPASGGDVITVNGASFRSDQGVAPGSFAAAFGSFVLVPDEVTIGGAIGTITSASLGQVNFVVPASLSPGQATVTLRVGGQETAKGQVTITTAGPGIFSLNPADPAQPGAVENADNTLNDPSHTAAPGSVVQIFATGYGPLGEDGSAPVEVYFADTPAQVQFSAPLPQFPGLWQINAQVPAGPAGQLPLRIVAGNLSSNAVTVWVH